MLDARRNGLSLLVAFVMAALVALSFARMAVAQEPVTCLNSDPSVWPKPSRPYFMMAMDTSGSMEADVGSASSCGFGSTRLGHARCAYRKMVLAYGGEINFGLATFDILMGTQGAPTTPCTAACSCADTANDYCFLQCAYYCYAAEINTRGFCAGCGPRPGDATTASGALIRVPMLQDHFWLNPPDASNSTQLLAWADNSCASDTELFAIGNTPLNGMLRDMKRYYAGTYVTADAATSYPSPLASQDLAGVGVNGGTACRPVNVILMTDGDESCDSQQDAVNAATDLYQNGVTVGGKTYKIRVHVINLAGGSQTNTDQIAAAGGTGSSYFATNETGLLQALTGIVGSSVVAETCDNKDNNCNGCTDEGYAHYCDVQAAGCCSWKTPAQKTACGANACMCCNWTNTAERTTCLSNYTATINAANPTGDLTLLPCTTAFQQTQPASWLCFDPKETCDSLDNNCAGGADEGITKCGSPLHCPQTETCNGQDDDCDGLIDESACSVCIPQTEICDGCDNDCDGLIDEGIANTACGTASPANCVGQTVCPQKTNPGGTPGACVGGSPTNACSNSPQTELCDGIDNNCNGIVDDGVAAVQCVPAGYPAGVVFGGNSQCLKGTQSCGGTCDGALYPSAEVCDGADNDCDGQVDEGAAGVGQSCGNATSPCSAGNIACVGGVLTCQGAIGPQSETCDGLDNDCDGQIDEAPLANAPPVGMSGCWTNPGNCCTFASLNWCPPAGASCNDNGALSSPCSKGTLACTGGAWVCQGGKAPSAESCDSIDNNCDGQVDEGLSGQLCGSDIGECASGIVQCTNGGVGCVGSVGPIAEVCDGLDNDCDGQVDEGLAGLGVSCGNATPPCIAGTTVCSGGQIVCQGATGPQSEICDGVDNDCNGQIDEGQLADAPPAGQNGCWNNPGNCCTFSSLGWCPPVGATCSGNGALAVPCSKGTLTCGGAAGWSCQGPTGPSAEVCDGVDNNCDGTADNLAPVSCVAAGAPAGLVYGGTSQCTMGTKTCGACAGFVGPSAELCDGVDNDCDGQVDEQAVGTAQACGNNQPPCSAGATACVNGALVCQGGAPPQPEVCDGLDNDCNGTADDAPLADGPPAGQNGCWTSAGTCCTFNNLAWCPPAGATCTGNGALSAPCLRGSLACAGAAGWVCQNPKVPAAETCDGLDNDCNGTVDDGSLPGVGVPCGSDTSPCVEGTIACAAGVLDCAGDVPPASEVCDGVDNDCDGQIDNGIPLGGACTPAYDAAAYPGARSSSPCALGILQCNGAGGFACIGATGPSPELCDGIDNDCDGTVDEVGVAPDGTDGSDNPTPPAGNIGGPCGTNVGACTVGVYACQNGLFACVGGQSPGVEECDCEDNDCDGSIDDGAACSASKACVKGSNGCQCAAPCGNGDPKCPPGQKCEDVTSSETGQVLGAYCTIDYEALCGDCSTKTVVANGNTECAPEGTELPGCIKPPVCACLGPSGCHDPCTGVTCGAGSACARSGPNTGTCVVDTCYALPCQGCDKVCNAGVCVDNPCKEATCAADQVCKPNLAFDDHVCVGSCAGVACNAGEECDDGGCAPSCDPPCTAGEVCDKGQSPPACAGDKCNPDPCPSGACCNPLTGACGTCPCEGVICPMGQTCADGDCGDGSSGAGGSSSASTGTGGSGTTSTGTGTGGSETTSTGTGTGAGGSTSASTGSGGSTGAATGTTSASSTTGGGGGGEGGGSQPKPIYSPGGCACKLSDRASGTSAGEAALAVTALALSLGRRRRRAAGSVREEGTR